MELGSDLGTAAFVVGCLMGGQLLGDVPAGTIAHRMGDRRSMLLALTISFVAFMVAGTMGIGNGMGAGPVMALGIEVAPPQNRAPFLKVWRLFQDVRLMAGPMMLGAFASRGTLAFGVLSVAGLGRATLAGLIRWVPRSTAASRASGSSPASASNSPGGPRDLKVASP